MKSTDTSDYGDWILILFGPEIPKDPSETGI